MLCTALLPTGKILAQELEERMFTERPSNSRLVLGYMSKQKKVQKWLTAAQVDLAKSCYLMMMREAEDILSASKKAASANQQSTGNTRHSPRLAKKRRLIADSSSEEEDGGEARSSQPASSLDGATVERENWKHLPRDKYKQFFDADGILNEFAMLWALREEFPLHFIVFKQCAAHLLHEANVEKIFSLAGRLSDPNFDPTTLQRLVRIHFNKKTHMPTVKKIRERYFQKYRKVNASNAAEKPSTMLEDPGEDAVLDGRC